MTSSLFPFTKEELRSLVNVALGKEKADLVIRSGSLVNVYTGEVLEDSSISVKGERIAYVGREANHTIGEATQIIEAQGTVLIPGLIDGHTHICTSPVEGFIERAMGCGTTTLMIDTVEMARVVRMEELPPLLDALADQPINVFPLMPSPVHPLPLLGERSLYPVSEVAALLRREGVIGLGESVWTGLLNGDEAIFHLLAQGLNQGQKLEGHSSGARNNNLVAYFAAGFSSCHEAITMEEARDRLRLGVCTMIREGSLRGELEAIAPIKDEGLDLRHLALVSDSINPAEHLRFGHMDHIVQKAINLGFDPVQAIRMATLNVAEHFSLSSLGGIAPGKQADIVIIPDIRTIKPEYVICKGELVAREGKPLVHARKHQYPPWILQTVRFPRPLTAADFRIPARGRKGRARARVIEVVAKVLVRESLADISVEGDELVANPAGDIIKAAALERQTDSGDIFTGLVKGFGMKRGAFASSYSWGAKSPMVVVGASEADMALAANRVRELQGGIVVCAGGQVLKELPLPIASYLAECSLEETASRLAAISQTVRELGSSLTDPVNTLQTLTVMGIPYFRISSRGMIDVVRQKYVDILVT